jgi:hypothetical protein
MKRYAPTSAVVLAACMLTGCVVQSVHPFATQKTKKRLPGIEDKWRLVSIGKSGKKKENMGDEPWAFSRRDIRAPGGIEKKSPGAAFDVVYFEVKNTVFASITAGDPGDSANEWWLLHVIPVHELCRVDLDDDKLVLTPLDSEWLKKKIRSKKVSLSHIVVDDNRWLFTATSEEWIAFLKEHCDDDDAFNSRFAHHFERADEVENESGEDAGPNGDAEEKDAGNEAPEDSKSVQQ